MNRTRSAAIGLAAALFLTGASGLVYQVLWSRYLGLLLGSSAVAIVVVLAAFMGGLAIGSWVFGRLSDRPISRLTLYGWLELSIIALSGAAGATTIGATFASCSDGRQLT